MRDDELTATTRHSVLDLERGKIREFSRAVHAELDDAGIDGEPSIPPTFLTTLNFVETGSGMLSGFDLARTLHAGQEYVFEGAPPTAGTRLWCTSSITDRFEKTGARGGIMRFAVETTEFRNENRVLVASAHMTSVETHPVEVRDATAPPAPIKPVGSEAVSAPSAPVQSAPPEDAPTGAGPTQFVIGPVTRTDFVRYQGASGDFNPIHHDDGFAQAAGYPTAFAPGMFQAGLVASFATKWFGARNIRRFSVRFRDQVWPGDVLTCSGAIAEVSTDARTGAEIVTVTLESRRQTGALVITGSASFARAGRDDNSAAK